MGKIRKIMHQETNLLNETYGFVLGGVEQWRLKVKSKEVKAKPSLFQELTSVRLCNVFYVRNEIPAYCVQFVKIICEIFMQQ